MIGSVGGASSLAYASAYGQRGQGAAGSTQQADTATQQQINKLRATDQKVRQHEQAHLAAAGGLGVGGASFQYQRGPDGKNYAVSGEVQIDVSPGQDAKSTIEKARHIQAAALAPSDPSPQDLAVAAAAAQMEARAMAELSRQQSDQNGDAGGAAQADVSGRSLKRALEAYNQSSAAAGSLIQAQA